MGEKSYFHFTLGPIQSFISQARRARDFWAGSFILSWLSAIAMREVIEQDGKILFPEPDLQFLKAVDGTLIGSDWPKQGRVPSRFMAEIGPEFCPKRVTDVVELAWQALAYAVRQADLAAYKDDTPEMMIWKRQIGGFWEKTWAIVTDRADATVLDRRKNWRSHFPPEEGGVKCMVMDGWQELSGTPRPDRGELGKFWEKLRNSSDETLQRDLREGEHLCAIAYVKRRFPRHFARVSVSMPSGWTAHGWEVPKTVPSVVYMSAVPWLAEVIAVVDNRDLHDFYDKAVELSRVDPEWGPHDEWATNIRRIREAIQAKQAIGRLRYLPALGGDVFYDSVLDNPRVFPDRIQAAKVAKALRALRERAGKGKPSPFYAVLFMDGDEISRHMSSPDKQNAITRALAIFTEKVPDIVYAHDGFLIYAGGDDVLALLPIDTALPCAWQLQQAFRCAFDEAFRATQTPAEAQFNATLSGAIEYAHFKMPLTRVLRDAHDLIDRVAKDGRGRDAIACRVWKPGGRAVEWAMPWRKTSEGGTVILQHMANEFRQRDIKSPFANRFFYRIRKCLEPFHPSPKQDGLSEEQAVSLMAAEYLNSGVNQGRSATERISLAEAKATVRRLLDQCRIWRRTEDRGNHRLEAENRWEVDGALLLRFLVQKGLEL